MASSIDFENGLPWDLEVVLPLEEVNLNQLEGENKKNLFLAVCGSDKNTILEFLGKILSAIRFELSKDALTFHQTVPGQFNFQSLSRGHKIDYAIFFGFSSWQVGLNLDSVLYETITVGGKTFLFADDLSKIQSNPDLKRKLWQQLKKLFLDQ